MRVSANRRILVCGGSGQVGTELCRLASDQREITGLSSVGLDVRDYRSVARAVDDLSPDLVINCAAYTAVDAAEEATDAAFKVNEIGAANLAQACAQRNVPLIHTSTDYVFDGAETMPMDESVVPRPLNVYGASKLAGENAVRQIGRNHCIVRAGWIFGCLARGFVYKMVTLARERETIRVVDDQYGVPCYAGDLARTLVELADRFLIDPNIAGTYHYSAQPAVTWYEFADQIIATAKREGLLDPCSARIEPITTAEYPTAARRPAYTVMDAGKLQQVVGAKTDYWAAGLTESLRRLPLGA